MLGEVKKPHQSEESILMDQHLSSIGNRPDRAAIVYTDWESVYWSCFMVHLQIWLFMLCDCYHLSFHCG